MAGKFSVSIVGGSELRKLLKEAPLPIAERERIVRQGVGKVVSEARGRAPGSLAAAVSATVEQKPSAGGVTVFGRVKVADRSRNGFRYAWALESSQKRRYRNRATGKLTRSWFRGSKRGVQKNLRAALLDRCRNYLRRGR